MNLKINDSLFNRLQNYHKETSFKNLDDLIEYILESYLAENYGEAKNEETSAPDEINQRLKDLGYL
jgi:hypothetical protein